MKQRILWLLLLSFLFELLTVSVADPVKNIDNPDHVDQCNGYCFSIFKPILDHFVELKQAANKNEELKEKVNTLITNNKELQIQLSNADGQIKSKDDQIKSKDDQIKSKDDQIKKQSDLLQSKEDTIRDLQSQLAVAQTQLKSKDDLIYVKEDQVKDKNEQIKNKEELLRLKENQIKEKDESINLKITQVNEQKAENLLKSNQIEDFQNQIKSVTEKLNERTGQLSICTRLDGCPSEGPSGIYKMKMRGLDAFEVPCNSTGWMIIQRRFDGSGNFAQNWESYKNGFGDVKKEFFIGLEKLHRMTEAQPYELYINLRDVNGTNRYARYDNFKIGSEKESYELSSTGKYSGTAGDSLGYHEKIKFNTYDKPNNVTDGNCSSNHHGGWWYNKCARSSLNGKYYKDGKKNGREYGIFWGTWSKFNFDISLTFVEMMIKPKQT